MSGTRVLTHSQIDFELAGVLAAIAKLLEKHDGQLRGLSWAYLII